MSLKIYDWTADPRDSAGTTPAPSADLYSAFRAATGWTLRLCDDATSDEHTPPASAISSFNLPTSNPATPGVGNSPGSVSLELSPARVTGVRSRRVAAEALARAIAALLGDLAQTRDALCQREAELAAGIPVAARPTDSAAFARRLSAILRGGCESLACQGAALYLLDAATTELKMRSAWGLHDSALTESARPLAGALADLEALTGHAVVLSTPQLCELWHAPRAAGAALCVPVTTSSTPLGTLWCFTPEPRDFDDRQTQLAEIIAGRIAAELEREVLAGEAAARTVAQNETTSLAQWSADQCGPAAIALEGWSLAAENVAGDHDQPFVADWFLMPNGTLVVALARPNLRGPEGVLTAAALRTALRCLAPSSRGPGPLVRAASEVLANTFAGNVAASLGVAMIQPNSGWFRYAATENVLALAARPTRPRLLSAIESRGRLSPSASLVITIPADEERASKALASAAKQSRGTRPIPLARHISENLGHAPVIVVGRDALSAARRV